MSRGRKPKPPELAVVDGNAGKRTRPDSTGRDQPQGQCPAPPSHLNKTAKSEWRRIAKSLHELGMLTALDRGVLSAYCHSWSMFVEASKRIEDSGYTEVTENGNLIQSPWVGIANRAKADFTKYAAQMGLDPTARTRLGIGEGGKNPKPSDKYF